MTHGSLFSGIGGFDYAADLMGWENIFHCEINPFCRTVLKYHFPNSIQHHDITKTDFTIYRGRIDVLTGGFPCQPFSVAGKRLGMEDDRHLWPEMLRAIREIQPSWIVGENVRGLVNWSGGLVFEQVQADLEAEGYEVLPFILPACAVDAPHRRDRVWFVAHLHKVSREQLGERKNETIQWEETKIRRKNRKFFQLVVDRNTSEKWEFGGQEFISEPPMVSQAHGIPEGLDGIAFSKWAELSNEAYGNAVVPPLVLEIFKAIEKHG
mgnify:CR=1 FL=1